MAINNSQVDEGVGGFNWQHLLIIAEQLFHLFNGNMYVAH